MDALAYARRRPMPPRFPGVCPECHTEITDSDKICKGCGRDLKPAPFEHAPGKFSYPDYPEFRGCR